MIHYAPLKHFTLVATFFYVPPKMVYFCILVKLQNVVTLPQKIITNPNILTKFFRLNFKSKVSTYSLQIKNLTSGRI